MRAVRENAANGNHLLDSLFEARRIFQEQSAARASSAIGRSRREGRWISTAVAQYRLVGYENRRHRDKDFRNDTVDAGEIGAATR